ncbi:hypothetical protein KIN20_020373, partial [Parelaphostrongylus tenuis]
MAMLSPKTSHLEGKGQILTKTNSACKTYELNAPHQLKDPVPFPVFMRNNMAQI